MNFGWFSLLAFVVSAGYEFTLVLLLKAMEPDVGLLGPLFLVLATVLPFGLLLAIGRRVKAWGGGPDRTDGMLKAVFISFVATFFTMQLAHMFVLVVFGL